MNHMRWREVSHRHRGIPRTRSVLLKISPTSNSLVHGRCGLKIKDDKRPQTGTPIFYAKTDILGQVIQFISRSGPFSLSERNSLLKREREKKSVLPNGPQCQHRSDESNSFIAFLQLQSQLQILQFQLIPANFSKIRIVMQCLYSKNKNNISNN